MVGDDPMLTDAARRGHRSAGGPGRVRRQRAHRLRRPHRDRPGQGGRDGRGVGGGRRHRVDRRPDRQDPRLPRRSASPAPTRSARGWSTTSASTAPSTTAPTTSRPGSGSCARSASTSSSTTPAGPILDHVLGRLADRARVVLCGAISSYNDHHKPPGPAELPEPHLPAGPDGGVHLLGLTGAGGRRSPTPSAAWVADGRLRHRSHVFEGLESGPAGPQRHVHRARTSARWSSGWVSLGDISRVCAR